MKEHSKPSIGWSIKAGRFFGIDVYLHVTFLLLLGFIGIAHAWAGSGVAAGLGAVGFLLAIFLCVLLHEFGHALAARGYGIRTRDIVLLPIGGAANLERIPTNPRHELWVAAAGPLVNVVIAAMLAVWLTITGGWTIQDGISSSSGPLAERLLAVNLGLVLFNLLPAFPMDGGRILRSLLAMRLGHLRATRIASNLGRVMAVFFAGAGFFYNPLLVVIAFFVWTGAGEERRVSEMRYELDGVAVRDAMVTRFEALSPEDRLDRAVELLLSGWQQDFPVLDGDRVVGVLGRDQLMNALRTRGPGARVAEVMNREFLQIEEEESIETAMFERRAPSFSIVPVTRGERVVGMLTMENLGELMAIRSALGRRTANA